MVELWALRDGLLLAKEMGLNNLIIEMDALSVVLLMNNNTVNLLMEPLLTDCRNLLSEIPNKQIVHIYREANQCADALAKLGASSVDSFVIFLYPPPVVESILASDKACLQCNRLLISLMKFSLLTKKKKKQMVGTALNRVFFFFLFLIESFEPS